MACDTVNRFENGGRRPGPGGLRIDGFEQARGRKRPNDFSTFCERCGEAGTDLRASLGGREGELQVSVTDVWLTADSMQEPLPQIAFKMKKKVGDGVFVVCSTMPHLLVRQLIDTSIDDFFGAFDSLHRGG